MEIDLRSMQSSLIRQSLKDISWQLIYRVGIKWSKFNILEKPSALSRLFSTMNSKQIELPRQRSTMSKLELCHNEVFKVK